MPKTLKVRLLEESSKKKGAMVLRFLRRKGADVSEIHQINLTEGPSTLDGTRFLKNKFKS